MERKMLRYGRLQMGAPDEHDVFIYVAVADNTDVDKVCEKFLLSKPEASDFGKAWFREERVKPDDIIRGAPLAIIYVSDKNVTMANKVATIAHEATHAAVWYSENVATNKPQNEHDCEEQFAGWVGYITDIAYALLYENK